MAPVSAHHLVAAATSGVGTAAASFCPLPQPLFLALSVASGLGFPLLDHKLQSHLILLLMLLPVLPVLAATIPGHSHFLQMCGVRVN